MVESTAQLTGLGLTQVKAMPFYSKHAKMPLRANPMDFDTRTERDNIARGFVLIGQLFSFLFESGPIIPMVKIRAHAQAMRL